MAITKKEGNENLPASSYAYVPDPQSPSTWKLRIDDSVHTSAAVSALGKGFRGNKVQIPAKDLPAVKRKVAAAYRKFFPDNDVPPILKSVDLKVEIDEDTVVSGLLDKLIAALSEFFVQEAIDDVEEDAQEIAEYVGPEAGSSGFMMSKSLNEELMQATFIALEPETVDLHGDVYSVSEVRKACHNFNSFCEKAYIDHAVETEDVSIVESYIAPSDLEINGEQVKKGTWLVVMQANTPELWQDIKCGKYNGVSIAAYATCEEEVDG